MASYVIDGAVDVVTSLLGTQDVTVANTYTPDERKALLGYRASTPLIVHSLSVESVSDITAAQVPANGHFVMSVLFAGGAGDPLFDAGAKPGSIGTRYDHPTAGTLYVFREPYEDEVVWHVEITLDGDLVDHGIHRWRGEVWLAYTTWPQKAFEGTIAFSVLDPDRIYDYYAKLLGATMTQWSVDTKTIIDFLDPDLCPEEMLPYLAAQFNQALRSEEDVPQRRERIKASVPRYKQKTLPAAVRIHLLSIGYRGYVMEVWVNPDNPGNWTDDDTGEKGNDWIEVEHGSRKEVPGAGYKFLGGLNPSDGEQMQITDFVFTLLLEFDDGGGVSMGYTPVLIGADAAETRDNLIAAVNASALTLKAIRDIWEPDEPTMLLDGGVVTTDARTGKVLQNYWPSSRVSLHINYLSGEPMDMLQSEANLLAFKEYIAAELRTDVLPVYTDIRVFATDLEVSGDFENGEQLEISDTMVLTEV
jgi:hypothetical protein